MCVCACVCLCTRCFQMFYLSLCYVLACNNITPFWSPRSERNAPGTSSLTSQQMSERVATNVYDVLHDNTQLVGQGRSARCSAQDDPCRSLHTICTRVIITNLAGVLLPGKTAGNNLMALFTGLQLIHSVFV